MASKGSVKNSETRSLPSFSLRMAIASPKTSSSLSLMTDDMSVLSMLPLLPFLLDEGNNR